LGIAEEEILSVSKGNLVFQSINGVAPQPDLDILNAKFGESTPLFYYILMEAWVYANGESLGPLGSLVVGNVFLNLIELNQESYLNKKFIPTQGFYGCHTTGEYYFTELITYALDLRPYTVDDVIPDVKTNFFDQHSVNQFSIAQGRVHPLQQTVQPDLIPENPITPFAGYNVDQFDPTLILGEATQVDIDLVASNAVANGLNSVFAVVKFIANINIEAIANGLIAPFPKKIARPIVNPPFVLPQIKNEPIQITKSQLRGRAITKTLNKSLRLTQEEALALLPQVQLEITNALTSIPPLIVLEDFIDGDIVV